MYVANAARVAITQFLEKERMHIQLAALVVNQRHHRKVYTTTVDDVDDGWLSKLTSSLVVT